LIIEKYLNITESDTRLIVVSLNSMNYTTNLLFSHTKCESDKSLIEILIILSAPLLDLIGDATLVSNFIRYHFERIRGYKINDTDYSMALLNIKTIKDNFDKQPDIIRSQTESIFTSVAEEYRKNSDTFIRENEKIN